MVVSTCFVSVITKTKYRQGNSDSEGWVCNFYKNIRQVKDVSRQTDLSPLTGDGVLGNDFDTIPKKRKKNNEEFKEQVPEISGRCDFIAKLKRKAPRKSYESKQMCYYNPKTSRTYSQRRSDYSTPRYSYRKGGSYQKKVN